MSEIKHYGTPRHSGRYPWGSGEDPQRSISFRQKVLELKKAGMSETEIAEGFGMKTTEMRARISLEKSAQRKTDSAEAIRLKEKGYSNVEIGKRMGINESSVRNLLNPIMQERAAITEATTMMLKNEVDSKKYLDVGAGVELHAGVTRTKLNTAIAELTQDGEYKLQYVTTTQLGTGKETSIKVLTKADVTYNELWKNKDQIRTITNWSEDNGLTYQSLQTPKSLSSKRIMVRFDDSEPSGTDMDGVIQLRRGVQDLSLGDNKYAQVRIAVDDKFYMKGMAIYSDDMPDGIDVIYNSNKNSSVGKLGAMKKMNEKIDLEDGGSIYIDKDGKQKLNEFGASIRQKIYTDSKGKEQLSPINIVGFQGKEGSGEEGSWDTWSKTLSSQFLSKQSPALAKKQLNLAYEIQKEEFDSILSITNPAVKERLLDSFADDCDSKAVHLKAAALPRQGSKVLIPITSLKDNECYTTMYKDGEKIAIIRYPHAGPFEIAVVTNNTKNREGRSVLGNASDAIGIHPKTAGKLSGADFDGDTGLTIPYSKQLLTSSSLKGLKDFNPSLAYPKVEGMVTITAKNKQTEMGKVSNLITDMTIKGANYDEIAAAVRHSMVVIDAEKHELNYQKSYIDNDIAKLKVKYQGGTLTQPKGASTLISRANSEIRVDNRRPITKADVEANPKLAGLVRKADYSVDPRTGRKVTVPTGEAYVNGKGKVIVKQTKSSKMYEVDDARVLSSGTYMEEIYAEYANSMKALGNAARKESVSIQPVKQSPSAKQTYASEVQSLQSKLRIAKMNAPLERQATLLANSVVAAKKAANPDLSGSEIKKIKGQAIAEARIRVGASKQRVVITDKEWEAIQAGAVSQNTLTEILNNANLDSVKQLATPRSSSGLSTAKLSLAKQLLNSGYTQAEIAERFGISVSTLSKSLKGD